MRRNMATFATLGLSLWLCTPLQAELPQLDEPSEWRGYFVGWKSRSWEYGFGADGEGILFPMKRKERRIHDTIKVHYHVQQPQGDKWINRSAVDWSSKEPATVNPRKPVPITLKAKDGSIANFTHSMSSGRIIVKPELLETSNTKPVRLAIEIGIHDFYHLKNKKNANEKEVKKILKSDLFTAIRKKDRKKISFKMHEKVDLLSNEMLADGATEIQLRAKSLKRTIELKQGNPKWGRFEIKPRTPFYRGFQVYWIITPEEAKQKDAWMSFSLK